MKTTVVVNPLAGNRKTGKIWPQIESVLIKSIGHFQTKQTSSRGDAIPLTRQALEEETLKIVAIGGDGHLNEVLNSFIENDIQVF